MTLFSGPVAIEPYEAVCMRIGFAYVVYRSLLPKDVPYTEQPRPNGLAHFFDLTMFADGKRYRLLRIIAMLCLLAYVCELLMAPALVYLSLLTVAVWTLRNSQGAIVHAKQLVCMVLIVQAIAYVWEAAARSVTMQPGRDPIEYDRLAVYWSQQAVVAVYVTAALSKIWKSRFQWIPHSARQPIQMVKTAEQKYHNELEYPGRESIKELAEYLLRHPMQTKTLMASALFLELFSPLTLANRLTMVAGGIILLCFHRVNQRIMNLHFSETQRLLLIFFVNAPFLLVNAWQWIYANWSLAAT